MYLQGTNRFSFGFRYSFCCYVFTICLLDLVIVIGDQFIEPYGSSGSLPLLSYYV